MGENLALNIESRGYKVSVYNRSTDKTTKFMEGRATGKQFHGALSIADFCESLSVPRKIILMVKAGEAVDKTIEALLPHLEPNDIVIDGGNSNYEDTERRLTTLAEHLRGRRRPKAAGRDQTGASGTDKPTTGKLFH